MLTLNNVTLRPLEYSDADSVYTWMADIELCIWGGSTPVLEMPMPRDVFRPFFEQHFAQAKPDQLMFGIEFEQRLVGFIQLADIDQRMRRAEVGIVIGEKGLQGKGLGTTALRLLLDYAFTVKNLERVSAEVFSFNERSQKLMERVGFQREGLLRQHDIHNGKRQDVFHFGILKPEFYQQYETIFKLAPPSGD
ncbi:MAG TPA: GNAT family protein [Ktedonobacterales bacterium]|nr:GNAT family protein [Ktedonobacterales bacterium]